MSVIINPVLIIAAAQQKVLNSFEQADATAPERAIAYLPDRHYRRIFDGLLETGLIRRQADRFWYDRDEHRRQKERTKRKLLWLLPAIVAGAAIAALLGGRLAA